jgi:hypothetical protein
MPRWELSLFLDSCLALILALVLISPPCRVLGLLPSIRTPGLARQWGVGRARGNAARNFVEHLCQLLLEFLVGHGCHLWSRMQHHVRALRQEMDLLACQHAYTPLDAIAQYRRAQCARHRDAKP